ncbi:MAG TPA: twin transmembrane helix small protein [Gammaproteobacteria bacterium]|jgi:cytochrome bd-type quinol oxidase subunit 2|nr:twin transmembrane helix small protein [Gammaproteobacteria bacterium]
MLPRLIIVAILLAILASLFSGMYFMLKDRGQSQRNVKALSIRIGLSLLLFALLIAAYLTGLIHPNAVQP